MLVALAGIPIVTRWGAHPAIITLFCAPVSSACYTARWSSFQEVSRNDQT